MKEMKTLNLFGETYEVVDAKAREAIANTNPDSGNTPTEQPVHMDMSGYENGVIVLKYADDSIMNVYVTFDENGNPIKFSNGVDEFTITWPAEEATS